MAITQTDVLYFVLAFIILNIFYFGFLKGAIETMMDRINVLKDKIQMMQFRIHKKYRSFIRKRKIKRFSKQARKEVRKLLKKFNMNFK